MKKLYTFKNGPVFLAHPVYTRYYNLSIYLYIYMYIIYGMAEVNIMDNEVLVKNELLCYMQNYYDKKSAWKYGRSN